MSREILEISRRLRLVEEDRDGKRLYMTLNGVAGDFTREEIAALAAALDEWLRTTRD